MKYLSVCSGIEAATVAWHPLGWEPLAFSEIETFPRKVLAHHYPDTPCHGDFTKLRDEAWIVDADVLVGGTPCQAFSVAGLRQSLSDDRGNLSLEFVRLANAIDHARRSDGRAPCTIVWENVPGVLSVKDNAFGCFLAAIVGNDSPLVPTGGKWTNAGMVIGPERSAAWRVLDAQYFGVAQRRRRVFVVASAGKGIDPAEVLFEREGVRRDSAPRREAGQRTAPTVTSGPPFSRTGNDRTEAEALITNGSHWDGPEYPHPTLNQSSNCGGVGYSNQELFSQRGAYLAAARMAAFGEYVDDGTASAMKARDYKDATDLVAVAFHPTQDPIPSTDGVTHALGCGSSGGQASVAVSSGMAVRRLTPRECERLQGFPDDYTRLTEKTPDGARYKALGNSMAVPVMRWIGERIKNNVQ